MFSGVYKITEYDASVKSPRTCFQKIFRKLLNFKTYGPEGKLDFKWIVVGGDEYA